MEQSRRTRLAFDVCFLLWSRFTVLTFNVERDVQTPRRFEPTSYARVRDVWKGVRVLWHMPDPSQTYDSAGWLVNLLTMVWWEEKTNVLILFSGRSGGSRTWNEMDRKSRKNGCTDGREMEKEIPRSYWWKGRDSKKIGRTSRKGYESLFLLVGITANWAQNRYIVKISCSWVVQNKFVKSVLKLLSNLIVFGHFYVSRYDLRIDTVNERTLKLTDSFPGFPEGFNA